ncbi:MAG TPA: hypothetical protein VG944_06170 [Fimbriimonas sp.]|nr:hypothetical protein [Fimbriimonas sp.]
MQATETLAYKPCTIPDGTPDYPLQAPQLDPRLVKAFVTMAHANLEAVQQMLAAEPNLLNASMDWADGDFETALEAAGHMGRRDIAEFLLRKGARLNIFCAAMLGNLPFVKACLEAYPSHKDSKGAHGFDLMHHAKAGGEASISVVEHLEALG